MKKNCLGFEKQYIFVSKNDIDCGLQTFEQKQVSTMSVMINCDKLMTYLTPFWVNQGEIWQNLSVGLGLGKLKACTYKSHHD